MTCSDLKINAPDFVAILARSSGALLEFKRVQIRPRNILLVVNDKLITFKSSNEKKFNQKSLI